MVDLTADNPHANDKFGAAAQQVNGKSKTGNSVYDKYDEFDLKAIDLVRTEKIYYEFATVEIRRQIKKARQYYACQFDNPKTSTGREKVFIPMTRWEVDHVVSKIHADEKALTVTPNNEKSIFPAFIMDKVIKYQMHVTRFPMYFKNSQYDLAIDGTIVYTSFWNFERQITNDDKPKNQGIMAKLKSIINKIRGKEDQVKSNKKISVLTDQIGFKQIDVLNCFIDPSADSIQDAISFIYRDVKPLDKIRRNKLYINGAADSMTGYVVENPDFYDARSVRVYELGQNFIRYEQPMGATYERWGRFPKSFITKKHEDDNTLIPGVITLGDLDTGAPIILRIELNPFAHEKKPFEECWFQKKQGKWYGVGPALKLIQLQEYLNKAVNRRIENEDIQHAGIYKIKRGSGISAKSLVAQPGALLEVDNMSDIEQLKTQDISQLSNGTMSMIQGFVERINGLNPVTLGMSASRSATGSMAMNQNADAVFQESREYINDFLKRFFDMWIKNDQQFLDQPFVMRVTGEDMEFRHLDSLLNIPDQMKQDLPPYRFINVDPESIKGSFDIMADIDLSQPKNNAEMAQRLLQAITTGKQLQINAPYDQLFNKYLDLIGLFGITFKAQAGFAPQPPVQPEADQGVPQPGPMNAPPQAMPAMPGASGQPSRAGIPAVPSAGPANGTTMMPRIAAIAQAVLARKGQAQPTK